MSETRESYQRHLAAYRAAVAKGEELMKLQPTPTQEENDLMALGLMNIDDKVGAPKEQRPAREHEAAAPAGARR